MQQASIFPGECQYCAALNATVDALRSLLHPCLLNDRPQVDSLSTSAKVLCFSLVHWTMTCAEGQDVCSQVLLPPPPVHRRQLQDVPRGGELSHKKLPVTNSQTASSTSFPVCCLVDVSQHALTCIQVAKSPKPVASCAMPAAPGMKIKTDSALVKKAREGVMEFLLVSCTDITHFC